MYLLLVWTHAFLLIIIINCICYLLHRPRSEPISWYVEHTANVYEKNITQVFFSVFRQIRSVHLSSSYASCIINTRLYIIIIYPSERFLCCVVVARHPTKKKYIQNEPSSLRSDFGKSHLSAISLFLFRNIRVLSREREREHTPSTNQIAPHLWLIM